MPEFVAFRNLGWKTITAGQTQSWDYEADNDYIIKFIMIVDRDDLSLSKLDVTARIEQNIFTKDTVPGTILGRNIRDAFELNLAIAKGQHFEATIKNNDTVDRTVAVVLVLYTPS